jgi:hypothetical protein
MIVRKTSMSRSNESALELHLCLAMTAFMFGASLYAITRILLVAAAWPDRYLHR